MNDDRFGSWRITPQIRKLNESQILNDELMRTIQHTMISIIYLFTLQKSDFGDAILVQFIYNAAVLFNTSKEVFNL